MSHDDINDPYLSALYGPDARHVPAWMYVQDQGGGTVALVGASRTPDEAHPLRYGSQRTHQLIVGEVIVRPHYVIASDALIGQVSPDWYPATTSTTCLATASCYSGASRPRERKPRRPSSRQRSMGARSWPAGALAKAGTTHRTARHFAVSHLRAPGPHPAGDWAQPRTRS
jgi:hypothetical protein